MTATETKDLYQTLGVEKNAPASQIKAAYRQLALLYHPDRNRDNPEAMEKMQAVNEAYAVLSNPEKRREYDVMRDRFGSSAYNRFRQTYSEEDIFKESDIFHVFEEMARSSGLRGVDEIFKDLGEGAFYRGFEYRRPGIHARGYFFKIGGRPGRGRGRASLPRQGSRFTKLGRKVMGKLGGVDFAEDGKNLHDTIRVAADLAATGGPYAYDHRQRDKKIVVKIPPGIRSGQKIRLAGLGGEGKGGGKPGDLLLQVKVKKPLFASLKDAVARMMPNK
jgi:DnaJ-class molecular chaperone